MNQKFKDFFHTKKGLWTILAVIVAVGIFFRVYNFHDWLRFNMDQGRDAILVANVVEGNEPLPLLGPKAGGTLFKLGPMPYYFQIISAKFFGNFPDKMAYPDLVSSILCIPLFFFFLRKYFSTKISLSLTALFSFSYYAIQYSRYAWNPNSTPFWTILGLYAIHSVISKKCAHKASWSAVAGIAIGVGVQLHTTLLLFFPISTIIIFGFLFYKKINLLKYFFAILAISLFLNVPQFINEYRTDGQNIQRFFTGIGMKQEGEKTIFDKALRNTSCWAGSNIVILSGYEIFNSCQIDSETDGIDLTLFGASVIFLFGGIFLGARYLRQEKDSDEKYFLSIVFLYSALAYLIYTPIAFTIDMRFFLMLFFFPFMLLGFWIKFLGEKLKAKFADLALILAFLLIISNLFFIQQSFASFAEAENGGGSGNVISNVTLSEIECVSQFIIGNSNGEKKVFLTGNKQHIRKSINSINFFVTRAGIEIEAMDEDENEVFAGGTFFLRSTDKKKKILKEAKEKSTPINYETCGRMLIYSNQQKI